MKKINANSVSLKIIILILSSVLLTVGTTKEVTKYWYNKTQEVLLHHKDVANLKVNERLNNIKAIAMEVARSYARAYGSGVSPDVWCKFLKSGVNVDFVVLYDINEYVKNKIILTSDNVFMGVSIQPIIYKEKGVAPLVYVISNAMEEQSSGSTQILESSTSMKTESSSV